MRAVFVNEYLELPAKSKEDIIRDLSALSKDELGMQLIKASEHGLTDIARWILDAGADVNVCDYLERTALMYASANGHKDIVKLLLEANADVNVCDYLERTALMIASRNGHEDVFELLKKYGAK